MKVIKKSIFEQNSRYNYYKNFTCPTFNISANIDITSFYEFINKNNKPLYISLIYSVTRIANDIQQFRQRILDNKVLVEYDTIHPAFLIDNSKDNFNFYKAEYLENFFRFVEYSLTNIELNKSESSNIKFNQDNDLIYISFIPFVSFTSITQPYDKNNTCPHISIGKHFQDDKKILIPISVQANNLIIDQNNISIFFEKLQELLLYPENYIKEILDKKDENEQNNYDTRIIRTSSLSQRKNASYPYQIDFKI